VKKTSEPEEVFRGNLRECLQHFAKSLPSKFAKGASYARKPMADFCGVKTSSVLRWLNAESTFPQGEIYLRLICFLDANGYKVIEMERMSSVRRNLTQLIGFKIISAQEAASLLGYSIPSTMFEALQGKSGYSNDKQQRIWDLWKENRDQIATMRLQVSAHVQVEDAQSLSNRDSLPLSGTAHGVSRKAVLSMMEGLLDMLQHGVLNGVTLEELSMHHFNPNIILNLQAHLLDASSKLFAQSEQRST
jgi:hypothetical protein